MPPVDSKYYIPRSIVPEETPKKTRTKYLDNVRLQFFKKTEEFLKKLKQQENVLIGKQKQYEDTFNKKMNELIDYTNRTKKIPELTEARMRLLEERACFMAQPYKEYHYAQIQEILNDQGPCDQPDIDNVADTWIRPGKEIDLYGTCFGSNLGKVLLEITSAGTIVELQVSRWINTHVRAQLSSLISSVPEYYGRIWLQTSNGVTSNVWPIMFYPLYSIYLGSKSEGCLGWYWGCSETDTVLDNVLLNDERFRVHKVFGTHYGDGWSELRPPHAVGQALRQGYHIGCSAFEHAVITIYYQIIGPKGITPPPVSELSPWLYCYDTAYEYL